MKDVAAASPVEEEMLREKNILTLDKINAMSASELEQECKKRDLETIGAMRHKKARLARSIKQEKKNRRISRNTVAHMSDIFTCELIDSPVLCADGRYYEKDSIKKWCAMPQNVRGDKVISPTTRALMSLPEEFVKDESYKLHLENYIMGGTMMEDEPELERYRKKEYKRKLKDRAKSGEELALAELGSNYLHGRSGFIENKRKARSMFQRARELGFATGAGGLAELNFIEGRYAEGMMYLTHAAQEGSDEACYFLGIANGDGKYDLRVNVAEAIMWLEKCVDGSCTSKTLKADRKAHAHDVLEKLRKKREAIVVMD